MYTIVIDRHAQKQLEKIPPPHFNRIVKAISQLAGNPRPSGCKKLTARTGYRIRVGDYRVIYLVQDEVLTRLVIDIGHRQNIYGYGINDHSAVNRVSGILSSSNIHRPFAVPPW